MVLQTQIAAGDYRSRRNIPLGHAFEGLADFLNGEREGSHIVPLRRALEYVQTIDDRELEAVRMVCGLDRAELLDALDFFSSKRTIDAGSRQRAVEAFRQLSTYFYDGWNGGDVQ